MRDFCYTAIEAVPARWKFLRGTEASIGTLDARPLCETLIPPFLSTITRRGAFTVLPEITSYFSNAIKVWRWRFSGRKS